MLCAGNVAKIQSRNVKAVVNVVAAVDATVVDGIAVKVVVTVVVDVPLDGVEADGN